jgi:hypothetical protein
MKIERMIENFEYTHKTKVAKIGRNNGIMLEEKIN